MKKLFIILLIASIYACEEEKGSSSIDPENWENRTVNATINDSLIQGTSYLSIYSHIYSRTERISSDLTATASLRNTNTKDTIYIDRASYYDTHGALIRTYFDQTIYLAPLETVEIVIDESDSAGGSGANFIFDWRIPGEAREPLFEAVMITTYGQQGISFTTQGIRIQ